MGESRQMKVAAAVLAALALTAGTTLAGPGKHNAHGGTPGQHLGLGHIHHNWVSPPVDYLELKNPHWGDARAIARGEALFRQNCVACHGAQGLGDGVMAAGLEHPPANLTRHFHPGRQQSDGYLFWRLTEGGRAEPFRSQHSAMPAFGDSLDKVDRWSLMAFIHARLTLDGGSHTHPWDGIVQTMIHGAGQGSETTGTSHGH